MPNREPTLALLLGLPCPLQAVPLDEPIKPIPTLPSQDPARAALGRQLFHDMRLSANNAVSCVSCHDLEKSGADSRDHSVGFSGKLTGVNAPTVFNAAFNFKQFWNGRADSLEAQIDAVIQNPVEMDSQWTDVVAKVAQAPRPWLHHPPRRSWLRPAQLRVGGHGDGRQLDGPQRRTRPRRGVYPRVAG